MNMPIPDDQPWFAVDESSTAPIEPPVMLVNGIQVTSHIYEWYNHEIDKTTIQEPPPEAFPDLFSNIPNTDKAITITIQSDIMPFHIYIQQFKDVDISGDVAIEPFYEDFSPLESQSRITRHNQAISFTIDPKPGKKYFTVTPIYLNYNFYENPDGDVPYHNSTNYLFKMVQVLD